MGPVELIFGGVGATAAAFTIYDRLKQLRIRNALMGDADELWTFRAARRPKSLQQTLDETRTRVIVIINSKGGVGKTTLAAKLATYFGLQRQLRVLVIDCDYQGSVSGLLRDACGLAEVDSQTDLLIAGTADKTVWRGAVDQLPSPLANCSLVSASATLARAENRLSMDWVFRGGDDVRFGLARAFLANGVYKSKPDDRGYDIVICDCPPRISTATLNALCAATHIIVPTTLTPVSARTVGLFFSQVRRIKSELNPGLKLAGIVPTLTQQAPRLTAAETQIVETTLADALLQWPDDPYIFERHIPKRQALAHFQIVDADTTQIPTQQIMTDFGAEVSKRIRVP